MDAPCGRCVTIRFSRQIRAVFPAPPFAQPTAPSEDGEIDVEWVPPAVDLGDLLVFVAVNASVTGQRNSRIHQRVFVLRPALQRGGVGAASQRPAISPGAWAFVPGSDFAPVSRGWKQDELRDGALRLELEGVGVRVAGRAAAISSSVPHCSIFRYRMQRLVQPRCLKWSGMAVRLSSGCGKQRLRDRRPRSDGARGHRARSGVSVSIYASGLGPTDPRVDAGQVFSGQAPSRLPVSVRVGGTEAAVEIEVVGQRSQTFVFLGWRSAPRQKKTGAVR